MKFNFKLGPSGRGVFWLSVLAGLAYGVFALRVIDNGDLWFQLMAGRWTLDHGSVPRHEIFLYAGADAKQVFGGWAFGLIYECAIRLGGLGAASWVNAAMWGSVAALAALGLGWRVGLAPKMNAGSLAAGLLLALAVVGTGFASRMGMRAEVTLYIFWMACYAMMERSLSTSRPWIFWLGFPLACWAEAWLHTGGFVLLPLWFVFLARSWGMAAFKGGPLRWPWALSLALALALPVLNPNGGFQAYVQAQSVAAMARDSALAAIGSMQSAPQAPAPSTQVAAPAADPKPHGYEIIEYLPVTDQRVRSFLAPFLALVLGALVLAAHWGKGPRPRGWWAEAGLVAVGAWMAASHVRGVGLFACFLAMPLAEAASLALARRSVSVRALAGIGALALALMGALMVDGSWGIQGRRHSFAVLTDVIKERSPKGANIFSTEIVSASMTYLLGEDYKMAHGGHELIDNPESNEHFAKVVLAEEGWQAELDKYGVDYVCLPYLLDLGGETYFYWANPALVASKDWKMLINSKQCVLFGRQPKGFELTQDQVDDQTLAYLDNLQILASVGYGLYGSQKSKELMELAKTKALALRQKMKAPSGK